MDLLQYTIFSISTKQKAIKSKLYEDFLFCTDNMIYGNTLVVFSIKEQIFATIIESTNIVNTYKTLFNMAWRSGKKI